MVAKLLGESGVPMDEEAQKALAAELERVKREQADWSRSTLGLEATLPSVLSPKAGGSPLGGPRSPTKSWRAE